MTAFWIAAALLTALALALLCYPLLRRRDGASASRKALNATIYRDQMAELERDLQSGSVSRDDYATARDELERRVLEDVAQEDTPVSAKAGRLPGSAIALLLALPTAAVALYLILGNPAGLDPAARQGTTAGQAPTAAEVEKMVAALAAKLEKNPDNPEGWVMLGRSYKVMGRYEEAAKAFGRAGPVMETEPVLMLELAELSAEQNEGKVEGKARTLLETVLKNDPGNLQALVIAGSDAYFRKNFAAAIGYWEKVLAQVPPDSQDATNLTAGIANAREKLGQPAAPVAAKPAPSPAKPAAAASTATSVSGRVDLDPALKAKAAPDDTVFILARPAQGPRMPLAVLRKKVADLPIDFTLDDSMAMSPDLKLSGVAELRIDARISKSGDAISRPGDLAGSISPVKPGATGLKIRIDQTVQ